VTSPDDGLLAGPHVGVRLLAVDDDQLAAGPEGGADGGEHLGRVVEMVVGVADESKSTDFAGNPVDVGVETIPTTFSRPCCLHILTTCSTKLRVMSTA